MFNNFFGGESGSELVVLGLLGLGLFAQNNELNLANNTTILLLLFLLFQEHEAIAELRREEECREEKCDEDRRFFARQNCFGGFPGNQGFFTCGRNQFFC